MRHPSEILISEYNYDLPESRIAAYPLPQRDASRLLVYKDQRIEEDVFSGLASHLPGGATLVFNNTRVIPARILFTNDTGGTIEVFCLEPAVSGDPLVSMSRTESVEWKCMVGNSKKWRQKELRIVRDDVTLVAEKTGKTDNDVMVKFSWLPAAMTFSEVLSVFGHIPIPPYIKREDDPTDRERYQTIYARSGTSVAAPTSGLHFTGRVLADLAHKNIRRLDVTLQVGAGTFAPVKSERIGDHAMHAEWIEVERETIAALAKNKSTVIAVGTTSLRTIESLYWMGLKAKADPDVALENMEIEQWEVYDNVWEQDDVGLSLSSLLAWMDRRHLSRITCRTKIMIAPPYRLKLADGIITNFHQPGSTLLLLIAAIVGDQWKTIYKYAMEHSFRFLSYGDSSLLLK